MIREALKILAALLENCASAINERLDPPLPMVSREAVETVNWLIVQRMAAPIPANDETITRH